MSIPPKEMATDRLLDSLLVRSLTADPFTAAETVSDSARKRLRWHVNHSLSDRQKQVIKYYLMGKKEREIAHLLGITQQVVNIYKQRAIRKLRQIFSSNSSSQASIG